ncbi:adenine deaminase [Rossellomorea vietnamensis]|uniref:Adenine deaminase n=1 Tax=Rossellomorea vietnamensis TaxID=218284 RepID=A0ACD4CBX5_9BACI|nr:adenine deaminase [Rossellomorea vietnamensis]UXH46045.1 adenine deaminase [Rossellomorea vietnamensis]
MSTQKESLKKRIAAANKDIPADLVIKNAKIIDVFNLEIMDGDVAITDGIFVGIGKYEGTQVIDAMGKYISPSFIDAHVHIESSMVTPSEFAKVVLPHGVTTVITDPHEIANVSGEDGIQFMLDDSEHIPLDVFTMLPSCVPATPFEHSGATLTAHELIPFYQHERVLGLAEVMDYPSLQKREDSIVDKITATVSFTHNMDGHLAGLDTNAINVYKSAGIRTDHECTSVQEAKERLRRGMYLLIREGSVAKDLSSLIGVVNDRNARRCLFCTDDKHLDDLIEEGSIDHNIRLAIGEGLDPILAIAMASLHAAECYGLHHKGAIAPGYEADFVLLENLETVTISDVFKAGKAVAKDGQYIGNTIVKTHPDSSLTSTVHIPDITEEDLTIKIGAAKKANIIEINPNQLRTNKRIETIQVENGSFKSSPIHDHLKIVVVERHNHTDNIGLGIVKGFGLKDGAIATTIAHDSHNIVATGTNDGDILTAVKALEEMNGGLVMVKEGRTIATLPLAIAGLMFEGDYEDVAKGLHQLKDAFVKLGFSGDFNPFLTLSFLTLPVIPELKLTDLGLFDVGDCRHIEVGLE